MASENAAPRKRTPSNSAPAAMRHLTQADKASASKEMDRIQSQEASTIPLAIQRLFIIQSQPARPACTKKRSKPGIQVIQESTMARTDSLPITYSMRESGRHKYNVSAP